jgi:hypothetical protein
MPLVAACCIVLQFDGGFGPAPKTSANAPGRTDFECPFERHEENKMTACVARQLFEPSPRMHSREKSVTSNI